MTTLKLFRRTAIAAALIATFTPDANAQSTTPATPPKTPPPKAAEKVDKVEVRGAAEVDERREDTATKIVVTSEEIMKNGDTQVLDVLKRLPGLTVQGNSVRMRGLGAGYTQFLLDGERPPPGFSLEQLAPSMIERIEIIRAATAEFSTQSIAGTVNIVLKKKVSFSQRDLRANYSSGTFYKAANVNFQISDKVDNLGYTLNGWVSRWTSEGKVTANEWQNDAVGRSIYNRETQSETEGSGTGGGLGPRLVWTFKNGDTLTWASFINSYSGDGVNRGSFTRADGVAPSYTSRNSKFEYSGYNLRTDLNWVKKLAEGAKLDLKVGAFNNRNDNKNVFEGFNATGQQNIERRNTTDGDSRQVSFAGKYTNPFAEGHLFVTGWDTSLEVRDEDNEQRDRAFPGVLPSVAAFNSNTQFDARIAKLAVFAQDEWNVNKNWSVYLGARWEGINTEVSGNDFSRATNRSSVFSPIMQTLYKLPDRKGEQLRLALTRTYKAPSTQQLVPRRFTVIENTATTPDSTGNPELNPELATGIDVAYEKFWDRGASMSASASMRRISDYTRTGLRFTDGRWVQLPINDGTATTRSLEFDAKFPVQTIWKAAPPIDFRYNMNRNWSSVESIPGPNNRLDAQTKFSATLGLDYRMQGGKYTAGGSLTYKSGGEVRTSANQTNLQASKRDLDLYGLWKITPKFQVRLTLANVLRPTEVTERRYVDAFGSTLSRSETPSKMTIRAGVELKL